MKEKNENQENNKQESRSANDVFRAIVDRQLDGVVILDQDEVVQYMNPAAERLLNSQLKEAVGVRFSWSLDKEKAIETEVDSLEGEAKVVQMQVQDATWKDKQAFLVSVKDITDQKLEEQLLQKAMDAAEGRASELEALKFVEDQMNQAALIEEAIQSGLETTLSLVAADAVWVLLPEEVGTTRMVVTYSTASLLKSEKRILGPGFHCAGLDLLLRGELTEPVLISEAGCIQQAGLSPNLPEKHWTIALKARNDPIGVLNLILGEDKELTENDLNLLENISQQIAKAIYRSRLYSEASDGLDRDDALSRISRMPSSALELPSVLENIVRLSIELVGAEAGSIGLLTPNGLHITFMANFPKDVSQQTISRGDDLVWEVVKTNEPVLITKDSELEVGLPENFCPDAQDLIIAPVFTGRETLGVLVSYTVSEDKRLTEFDLALIKSLGQQAGIAVQNAQLFFEVQQLTISDALTGLNNQKSFINLAVSELERSWRYKRDLSLISIVIDDIRKINDKFGREAGDKVLRAVAEESNKSLRRVDIIGRYQGNNFTILLPETKSEVAVDVAERLRVALEKRIIRAEKGTFTFTASFGAASPLDNEHIDLERLIDRANHALYGAVQAGGNRTFAWGPGTDLK